MSLAGWPLELSVLHPSISTSPVSCHPESMDVTMNDENTKSQKNQQKMSGGPFSPCSTLSSNQNFPYSSEWSGSESDGESTRDANSSSSPTIMTASPSSLCSGQLQDVVNEIEELKLDCEVQVDGSLPSKRTECSHKGFEDARDVYRAWDAAFEVSSDMIAPQDLVSKALSSGELGSGQRIDLPGLEGLLSWVAAYAHISSGADDKKRADSSTNKAEKSFVELLLHCESSDAVSNVFMNVL